MTLRHLVSLPATMLALAVAAGCQLDKASLLAPSDAQLTLAASAGALTVNQTVTLTIHATRQDGSKVPDGTEIVLSASDGELLQVKVRTSNGSATAGFKAGGTAGVVRIEASSGSASGVLELPVASGLPTRLDLAASPAELPFTGGATNLTATAFTADGQRVVGVPVTFHASSGSFSPTTPVLTDGEGIARAQLTASVAVTVRATALNATSPDFALKLRAPILLDLKASSTSPVAGETVTFTVTATQEGKPAKGSSRIEFGDGAIANLGTIEGAATATHVFAEGGYNVSAFFGEPAADGTIRSSVRVDVRKGNTPAPPSPSPTPNSGDAIDPRSIIWLSPASTNVSNWAVTSTVTSVDIRGDDICINHTKSGQWPLVSIDSNPPNIEGNPMIVVNIGGQWYGAGFDWFGQGRTCKHMPAVEYGRDQIRVWPLDSSWPGPRSGDMIGLLVSSPSSDRIPVRSVNERSNIVLIRWP